MTLYCIILVTTLNWLVLFRVVIETNVWVTLDTFITLDTFNTLDALDITWKPWLLP
jgi:hypothetical protein